LINVTLASSQAPQRPDRRRLVLDPLCGRGTTLNCSLLYGHDAAGVELETREFDGYCTFLLTYLQRKRIKHDVEIRPGRAGRGKVRRLLVRFSADAAAYRAGHTQTVNVVNGETSQTGSLFAAGRVDAIVTDAPYGVQHGSRHEQQRRSRSPLELIEQALPGWLEVLRAGAAIGIAFNTLVIARAQLAAVLVDAGLEVLGGPGYDDFAHRVDQGIVRDLVVARRGS
jgi:tRNA G10  N-methylase Trm11